MQLWILQFDHLDFFRLFVSAMYLARCFLVFVKNLVWCLFTLFSLRGVFALEFLFISLKLFTAFTRL